MRFLRASETKKILAQLEEQYGIKEIPGTLIQAGDQKLRLFSANMPIEQLTTLNDLTNIENMGMYFLREEHDIRLSFDTPHLLKKEITKSILDISEDEYKIWIRGNDIPKEGHGTVLVRYNGDFVGSGKLSQGRLINHIPKERRIRSKIAADLVVKKG